MKRIHLIITGDVQGVGFRAWITREAKNLELVGWVKNRTDDTVEIVAEGKEKELQKLIELCHQGPEISWVKDVLVEWSEATNELIGFEVIF